MFIGKFKYVLREDAVWFRGPHFLWERTLPEPDDESLELSPDDPEVRCVNAVKAKEHEDVMLQR